MVTLTPEKMHEQVAKRWVNPISGKGPKLKYVIFGITTLIMILLLNGCGRRPDTDVTSSPKYNFSSFAGTVWKTKVKVALADLEAYTGEHHITLLAPDAFDPTHPKYRPPPNMEKMIAVLPVGTRLRIERLMQDNGDWGGVRITASLEGERDVYLDRSLLAKNRFIRPGDSDSKEWGVDPDLLEKVEK